MSGKVMIWVSALVRRLNLRSVTIPYRWLGHKEPNGINIW